jgi:hypothetical protein
LKLPAAQGDVSIDTGVDLKLRPIAPSAESLVRSYRK